MNIKDAVEKEITRNNCETCPKLYWNEGRPYCDVTEEPINSGDEYCVLEDITNDSWIKRLLTDLTIN